MDGRDARDLGDADAALDRLTNAAVSTSGDAEQWMTAGGVRYSHVIDFAPAGR